MASNDTYSGALEVLAKQLATMRGLVDANLPFVDQLFQMVTNEMRSPEMAMQKAGLVPPAGGNPQGNAALGLPPGVMPGPGGASAMAGANPIPGGPPTPQALSPADLAGIMR